MTEGGLPAALNRARFPMDRWYMRNSDDINVPAIIGGREPRFDERCQLCTIVHDLVTDHGYTRQHAIAVEYDVHRMFYDGAKVDQVFEYLTEHWEVDYISHRTLKNHIRNHIISRDLFHLQKIHALASGANIEDFASTIVEYHMLTVQKGIELMANGGVKPRPGDVRESTKFLAELRNQSKRAEEYEIFLQAFRDVLTEVFEDEERQQEVIGMLHGRYKQLEAARQNGE